VSGPIQAVLFLAPPACSAVGLEQVILAGPIKNREVCNSRQTPQDRTRIIHELWKAHVLGERRFSVPTFASRVAAGVALAARIVFAELTHVLGKESYANPAAFQDFNHHSHSGFSH
jgi:hypothetical protein